jgi:cysteine desulfurase
MKRLYFDYNATTPVLPEVFEAMRPYFMERFGNPGSPHAWGMQAKSAVAEARAKVAACINCGPESVFFTSCATESNNLVLQGVFQDAAGGCLITSRIEHPAVLEPAHLLARRGVRVIVLPVGADGVVRLEGLDAALDDAEDHLAGDPMGGGPRLLSLMLANNETGVLQPVAEAVARAKARGFLCHTDAAQAVGKIPVDVAALGVDFLGIAGHKLYAPKGVGALYASPVVNLPPLMYGGGQEGGLKPGTENVPYIVALGAACALTGQDMEAEIRRQRSLGDRIYHGLHGLGVEFLLNGKGAPRLPNTMSVSFKGLRAGDVLSDLVSRDVGASAGAACHSGGTSVSHVLEAMDVPMEYAQGTIRFSWGRLTTEQDVDALLERLEPALRPTAV